MVVEQAGERVLLLLFDLRFWLPFSLSQFASSLRPRPSLALPNSLSLCITSPPSPPWHGMFRASRRRGLQGRVAKSHMSHLSLSFLKASAAVREALHSSVHRTEGPLAKGNFIPACERLPGFGFPVAPRPHIPRIHINHIKKREKP